MAIGIKRPPIFKIFCTQLVITLLISTIYYLLYGRAAGYSALLGGLIFVIPQLYFGITTFMFSGARAIDKIVVNIYKGESSKIIIIVIGFALVLSFIQPIDYFALYSSFITILIVNFFSVFIK
jgi:ATP synthase protein I